MPKSATAVVGFQGLNSSKNVETSCTILLHYDHGLLVTVKASKIAKEKHHLDTQEDQVIAGCKSGDASFGADPRPRIPIWYSPLFGRWQHCDLLHMEHFITGWQEAS
ncbi:hypothetical protein V1524DRAFT_443770 [Lipomyces starkeyi]